MRSAPVELPSPPFLPPQVVEKMAQVTDGDSWGPYEYLALYQAYQEYICDPDNVNVEKRVAGKLLNT